MELRGIAASVGVGIGTAVRVVPADLDYSHVSSAGAEAEQARLDAAVAAFTEKTRTLADAAREKAGEHQAEILEGQLIMLSDPFLQGQLAEKLSGGACAEQAVDEVCQSFIDMFTATGDELMAQRATDVGDMRSRLLSLLLGREEADLAHLPAGTVLVVHDLTPSMATALDTAHAAGIVAETGGVTSHSAILARAMELPAVLSVPGALDAVSDGDALVVDGDKGLVLVKPEAGLLKEYEAKRARQLADRAALGQFRGRPTHTADGKAVQLYGNIGSVADAQAVAEATGEGVGLFRTEFLFMDRSALPTEAEQFEAYKAAAQLFPAGEVIIRTLDVGGDKDIPYLGLTREENPFLGFRAVRYCLDRRELFLTQLRALLRASAFGPVKIMLPLVTRLTEPRQARALLEVAKGDLDREGIAYNKDVPLGVMVETPAAVLMADALAREADFFSIGTNDLTQYTMVADRGNPQVAAIGSPFDPAVLRAVRQVITAGHAGGIPVGMCGEAAADPRLIPVLLSFGLDEFSVGGSSILAARREIARWGKADADRVAAGAMELETEEEVRAALEESIRS